MMFAPMQATLRGKADTQPTLYNKEEILTPFWKGNTCYQESVLPVANASGGDLKIPLLFPIERVIEVKNAALTTTYVEGKDYDVQDGELVVYWRGDISIMPHTEFYPSSSPFKNLEDGGYLCFSEGAYFHNRQIVVTYTHTAQYKGYVPENKGDLLPNLQQKLKAGGALDLFVLGDSISAGANSSGFYEISTSPYMPTYPQLFADGLQQTYGLEKVNLYNHSVGGKNSAWGVQEISKALAQHENVDLAVLAFGMNDGDLTDYEFNDNLVAMMLKVRESFPKVEILLVAPMLPNPKSSYYQNQAAFASSMQAELETSGVAVANMTKLHSVLLMQKAYADMTGNNINHPNDYLARVYAQTLLSTVKMKEKKTSNGKSQGCGAWVDGGCVPILCALAMTLKRKSGKKSAK